MDVACNKTQDTALHLACRNNDGSPAIIRELLNHDADIHAQNLSHKSPLWEGLNSENAEVMHFFLKVFRDKLLKVHGASAVHTVLRPTLYSYQYFWKADNPIDSRKKCFNTWSCEKRTFVCGKRISALCSSSLIPNNFSARTRMVIFLFTRFTCIRASRGCRSSVAEESGCYMHRGQSGQASFRDCWSRSQQGVFASRYCHPGALQFSSRWRCGRFVFPRGRRRGGVVARGWRAV